MAAAQIDRDLWEGARVLLTGHTGFKGAWLSLWLERLGADVHGLALPPEQELCVFNLASCGNRNGRFGDIRDKDIVSETVAEVRPELVIHMAAQSLVRRGFRDPLATLGTNLDGTANLLEALRHHRPRCILVITSDKVYANQEAGEAFKETAPLGGKDPYSASKACQEIVTQAFATSYFSCVDVPVATARAGNVIGGGDWAQDRLVSDIVRAAGEGTSVKLRNPKATRPWQHVLDPLCGYLLYMQRLLAEESAPSALNFGPVASHSVASVAGGLGELLDVLVEFDRTDPDQQTQAKEATNLDIDPTAAHRELGWVTRLDLRETLQWIAEWHRQHTGGADMRDVTLGQIAKYEEQTGQ